MDPFELANNYLLLINLLLLICALVIEERRISTRRWLRRTHLNERPTFGAHATVFTYFRLADHESFFKLSGM